LFALQTGTSMQHVVYKGSAPALTDLMGGHVQVMFDNVPSAAPLAAAGKVRELAVTGAGTRRSRPRCRPSPRPPCRASSPIPGSPFTPAGTPPAVVRQLNAAVNAAVKRPNLLATFEKAGLDSIGGTPEELARYQSAEILKWSGVVKAIKYVPV
jgi:tripartite-type tricarboxylate transporter receptor subunit TctC